MIDPMTAALVFGFLLILAGCLLPPATTPLAWACAGSLATLQAMIEWVHRVPGNHVWVKGLPDWWLVAFYAVFGTFAFCLRHRRAAAGWVLAAVAVWIAVGGLANHRRGVSGRLSCTFLSVGHGAAVLLEMPDGAVLPTTRAASTPQIARALLPPALGRGSMRSTRDHHLPRRYGPLQRRSRAGFAFSNRAGYVGPGMFASDKGAPALPRSLAATASPAANWLRATGFRAGKRPSECSTRRAASAGKATTPRVSSWLWSTRGVSILLTGDLKGWGWRCCWQGSAAALRRPAGSHHGSWRSDAAGLAAWCSPLLVVVSGHRDPRQAALESAYRQVGAELIYTGERGAVEVTIENGELRVRTHL